MKEIKGVEKTISDLLRSKKYTIHYYQREYRWGKKQIEELIDDLTDEFNEYYSEEHERAAGATYGHYYLGSVVITDADEERAIIDGQQRLTSLTLLLIYLNNLQTGIFNSESNETATDGAIEIPTIHIEDLIFSEEWGTKSFNIHVEEREKCLEAIFNGQSLDVSDQPESVQAIYTRYNDIKDIFPEELKGRALPFFIEWLIKKVDLVEIKAKTEQDAHKIFVSMNDRGLSLTPTEMLKGYLLAEITDDRKRNEANDLWKQQILKIKSIDEDSKEEDADFIKNWLRSQYAETIREGRRGAVNKDWDLIGTEFHKWTRENAKEMKLAKSSDYEAFVSKEFKLFSDLFVRLRKFSSNFNKDFEYVFYNANRNFTFQYQLIFASIDREDSPETIDKKIRVVSCFVDQFIARRVLNFKTVDYSTIKQAVFNMTKNIRKKPLAELPTLLETELSEYPLTSEAYDYFYLNQFTGRYMLHILSRITHYIEEACGVPTKFEDYVNRRLRNAYDIEHIWADKIEQHSDEFSEDQKEEFERQRNKFGALLVLPRDKNRSFQDATYAEKLPMYFGENLLAKSLNEQGYLNNPQFLRFINENGFGFKAHPEFRRQDIADRQRLYAEICERIWNVEKLYQLAA
jgi:uncharacterized protein with ParB-like and HNH nuclease domain